MSMMHCERCEKYFDTDYEAEGDGVCDSCAQDERVRPIQVYLLDEAMYIEIDMNDLTPKDNYPYFTLMRGYKEIMTGRMLQTVKTYRIVYYPSAGSLYGHARLIREEISSPFSDIG